MAVCSEIRIKYTYALCGQNVECFFVKPLSNNRALKGQTCR